MPDRWQGQVPDHELISRLERVQKIIDLMIAATRLILDTRDQVGVRKTEIAKLGEI